MPLPSSYLYAKVANFPGAGNCEVKYSTFCISLLSMNCPSLCTRAFYNPKRTQTDTGIKIKSGIIFHDGVMAQFEKICHNFKNNARIELEIFIVVLVGQNFLTLLMWKNLTLTLGQICCLNQRVFFSPLFSFHHKMQLVGSFIKKISGLKGTSKELLCSARNTSNLLFMPQMFKKISKIFASSISGIILCKTANLWIQRMGILLYVGLLHRNLRLPGHYEWLHHAH